MPFTMIKALGAIFKGVNSREKKAAEAALNHLVDTYNRLESQVKPGKGKDAFAKLMKAMENFEQNKANDEGVSLFEETLNIMIADMTLPAEVRNAAQDALAKEQTLILSNYIEYIDT